MVNGDINICQDPIEKLANKEIISANNIKIVTGTLNVTKTFPSMKGGALLTTKVPT